MQEQTRKLLEECSAGCKMAINSINQVSEYIEDASLSAIIEDYNSKHKELEAEAVTLLQEEGKEDKEPGAMAAAFSWITTEMKMKIKNDNNKIAKLMMDGCNMGIQSMTEHINHYTEASHESVSLAKNIVKTEEAFMKELKSFL